MENPDSGFNPKAANLCVLLKEYFDKNKDNKDAHQWFERVSANGVPRNFSSRQKEELREWTIRLYDEITSIERYQKMFANHSAAHLFTMLMDSKDPSSPRFTVQDLKDLYILMSKNYLQ